MTQPLLALKKAIRGRLLADAALATAMGGPSKVFDEVPRNAETPYAVFGEANVRDFSTGSGRSHETILALLVWSRQGGSQQALTIAERIEALLHDAALTLDGHRLVTLQLTTTEVRRPSERETWRVVLRFRAFTEAL